MMKKKTQENQSQPYILCVFIPISATGNLQKQSGDFFSEITVIFYHYHNFTFALKFTVYAFF